MLPGLHGRSVLASRLVGIGADTEATTDFPQTGRNRSESACVCCLFLLAFGLGPRVALAAWWIFGDKVDAAFDTWVWPALGLLFLPWTTIFYVIAWSPIGGVSDAEWLFVALGFLFDLATYSARRAQAIRRARGAY